MPNNAGIPVDTLREVDDLISDLVRAKLTDSLSTATKSQEVPGTPHSPANLPLPGVETQGVLSPTSGAGSAALPKETQRCKKQLWSCRFCQFQREEHSEVLLDDKDLEMLDGVVTAKTHQTLALLVAAQKHSTDPKRRDPREWIEWCSQLFATVVGIGTLGAGFTFTIVFSGIEAPQSIKDKRDEAAETKAKERIRTYLAASWLLFVISIGLTSIVSLVFSVRKAEIVRKIKRMDIDHESWGGDRLLVSVSCLMGFVQLPPVGAFLASAEALRQYHNRIGQASLAVTGLAGVLIMVCWCQQNLSIAASSDICILVAVAVEGAKTRRQREAKKGESLSQGGSQSEADLM